MEPAGDIGPLDAHVILPFVTFATWAVASLEVAEPDVADKAQPTPGAAMPWACTGSSSASSGTPSQNTEGRTAAWVPDPHVATNLEHVLHTLLYV